MKQIKYLSLIQIKGIFRMLMKVNVHSNSMDVKFEFCLKGASKVDLKLKNGALQLYK